MAAAIPNSYYFLLLKYGCDRLLICLARQRYGLIYKKLRLQPTIILLTCVTHLSPIQSNISTPFLFFTGSACVVDLHNCHRKACQIEEYGVDQTVSCPSTKHRFNDSANPSAPFCFIFRLASSNRPSSRSSSATPKIECSILDSFPEIFPVLRCGGSQAFSLS